MGPREKVVIPVPEVFPWGLWAGVASGVAAADWPNVTAVRIWLLARSVTAEPGLANTSTYTMGDQTVTVSDGFQRQLFPLVVQLRN